jgi:hypothetical protein
LKDLYSRRDGVSEETDSREGLEDRLKRRIRRQAQRGKRVD